MAGLLKTGRWLALGKIEVWGTMVSLGLERSSQEGIWLSVTT
jgi:hypothetical protein